MCNRYALSKKQERLIIQEYGSLELFFSERYNIAPTDAAPVVLLENGKLVCKEMRWGFKPRWSKGTLTNAKFETLDQKPTFKNAFASRRALIPATGFYEWTDFQRRKQPILFSLPGNRLFFFAALWSTKEPEGNFVIITVPPSEQVREVHDRMPLILAEKDYAAWLGAGDGYKSIQPVSENFKTTWMNPALNSSRNKDAGVARPLMATVKSMPYAYDLPEGLPEHASVTILRFDVGSFDVEFEGKAFRVASACVALTA